MIFKISDQEFLNMVKNNVLKILFHLKFFRLQVPAG